MILTAGVVVMILVALTYAGNIMNYKLAENEYTSTKQFMQTTAQQLDDIAWTIGRTQTVTYSSKFGALKFQPLAVTYNICVRTTSGWDNQTLSAQTGILLFNMPVSAYTMGNNYFGRVPNSANGSFLLWGASASVAQVFCQEKLPMSDGSYLRVALVPTMRVLSSTVASGQNYLKCYMPSLEDASHSYSTQSLTVTGSGINKITRSGVDCLVITASYPQVALGYDEGFFNFDYQSVTLDANSTPALTANSVVEFYVGNVQVVIGGS
jgi:hypothetical protein